jgi:hypothetical protein
MPGKSKPADRRTLDAFVVARRSFDPAETGAKDQERRRDERGTIEEEDGMLRRH